MIFNGRTPSFFRGVAIPRTSMVLRSTGRGFPSGDSFPASRQVIGAKVYKPVRKLEPAIESVIPEVQRFNGGRLFDLAVEVDDF